MANDVLITPASGQIDFCCGTSISKICNISGEMKQEGGALTFCTTFLPSHGGPTSYGKLYQNRVTEDYSDHWGSGGTAARTNLWYKGQGTGAAAQNLSRCGNCAFEIICTHRIAADVPEKMLNFNSPPNKGSFDWDRFYRVRIYIDWAHSITQSCPTDSATNGSTLDINHLAYVDNYNGLFLNFNNLRPSSWDATLGSAEPGGFSNNAWIAYGYCRGFGSNWFTNYVGSTAENQWDIRVGNIASAGGSFVNAGPSQWYSTFELYPHCGSGTGSGSNQYYTYDSTTWKLVRPRDAESVCQYATCSKGVIMKGACDWDLDIISKLNIYTCANYCRCGHGWNLTRQHCYGGIMAGSRIVIIGFCR